MSTDKLISENNKETIRRLRSGDDAFFEAVYRFYFKGLCAFASQYVSFDESQEIVQDTMMWLWENREQLIPEMSLKSLLFMIVKNKSLNSISHTQIKNRIHQELFEKYENQFSNPDFYTENELMQLYTDAVDKLPRDSREAFLMNRVQGLTYKEIADRLDVSPQTVNYRIGQALKFLRTKLKDYLPLLLLLCSQLGMMIFTLTAK